MLVLAVVWWIVCWSAYAVRERIRNKQNKLQALTNLPRAFWGMLLAHLGIAVFILGVNHINAYSIERDVRLAPGDSADLGQYEVTFRGAETINGPNYNGSRGHFDIREDGTLLFTLEPEKRFYPITQSPMTEAAINGSLVRDIYISMGEALNNGAWTARLYYKSFAQCIWLGGFMMAFGGLLAMSDRRYRRRKSKQTQALDATVNG